MNLKESLAFMLQLTMRTFTMVYMLATEFVSPDNVDAHKFFDECADWFNQQIRETETQRMIDDLYRGEA